MAMMTATGTSRRGCISRSIFFFNFTSFLVFVHVCILFSNLVFCFLCFSLFKNELNHLFIPCLYRFSVFLQIYYSFFSFLCFFSIFLFYFLSCFLFLYGCFLPFHISQQEYYLSCYETDFNQIYFKKMASLPRLS